jgi:cytochrome c peroxidase
VRTPTLLNVAWGQQFAWDGHFRNLEAVAFGPISSSKIMNMPGKDLIGRLAAVPGNVKAFHAAKGDEHAISDQAKRGFDLFNGKANCAACHSSWAFTDGSFHDIGVARDADLGRGKLFPNSVKLRHAFKTPTLRDVACRAPYMHDGSIAILDAVIDLYDRGGIDRPSRSAFGT